MDRYVKMLKDKILTYYPIPSDALSLIDPYLTIQHLSKNEFLLREGQMARNFYFICSGVIIAYFSDEKGNTYNKNIFLKGDFAASKVSSILKSPSQFALQAIEATIVVSINYEPYRTLITEHDNWKSFYISYLEKNWIIEKEEREVSLVMESATIRYLKLLSVHADIDVQVPLQHIASHLGITPTQLSRIRKVLKKEKRKLSS